MTETWRNIYDKGKHILLIDFKNVRHCSSKNISQVPRLWGTPGPMLAIDVSKNALEPQLPIFFAVNVAKQTRAFRELCSRRRINLFFPDDPNVQICGSFFSALKNPQIQCGDVFQLCARVYSRVITFCIYYWLSYKLFGFSLYNLFFLLLILLFHSTAGFDVYSKIFFYFSLGLFPLKYRYTSVWGRGEGASPCGCISCVANQNIWQHKAP